MTVDVLEKPMFKPGRVGSLGIAFPYGVGLYVSDDAEKPYWRTLAETSADAHHAIEDEIRRIRHDEGEMIPYAHWYRVTGPGNYVSEGHATEFMSEDLK